MKMKWILAALIVVILALAIGIGLLSNSQVTIDGVKYSRSIQELDYSGRQVNDLKALSQLKNLRVLDLRGSAITVEKYQYLSESLPNCQILWDIPFHGLFLDQNTTVLSVLSLTDEDVQTLEFLPRLETVDATKCADYAQLEALRMRRPEVNVVYNVMIGDNTCPLGSTELILNDVDLIETAERMHYLPNVQWVRLFGTMSSPQYLPELLAAYPDVAFTWETPEKSFPLDPATETLSLSRLTVTRDDVAALLEAMPNLKDLDLRKCTLNNEELMSLADMYPNCRLLWNFHIGKSYVPTDAEEVDISDNELSGVGEIEAILPYFYNVKKVIMSNCGISSEEMDALNKRHDDIRFVWTVLLGGVPIRTDANMFAPCVYKMTVFDWDIEDLKYCEDMECIDMGHMDITHCEWAANMPHLKYLIIADTHIQDITPLENLKELVFLEMFLTVIHDVRPLLGCTALEDLNLCYDDIYEPEVVGEMTWLKRLWWDGPNYLAKQALEGKLPNTEVVWDSGSSTGGTWRLGQRYFEMRDMMGMFYMIG